VKNCTCTTHIRRTRPGTKKKNEYTRMRLDYYTIRLRAQRGRLCWSVCHNIIWGRVVVMLKCIWKKYRWGWLSPAPVLIKASTVVLLQLPVYGCSVEGGRQAITVCLFGPYQHMQTEQRSFLRYFTWHAWVRQTSPNNNNNNTLLYYIDNDIIIQRV